MPCEKSGAQTRGHANLHDQTKILSGLPLISVFGTLSTAQFITFMDQVAIATLLPSIAVDIHAKDNIAWVGTASLMTMTAFASLWGRGSDLFGRKNCLLGLLVVLELASIGCALAKNFSLFCASRVFAGIANGGISSLVQMIVSDHVTLKERGKYQGILGAMVGAGSVAGVMCSSLLDMRYSWRSQYYLQCGLLVFVFAICWIRLPSYTPTMGVRELFAELDKPGLFTIISAVVLILTATSQGVKAETPWNSSTIIGMYTAGMSCFLAFLIIEWRLAKMPIIPLRNLGNRSIAAMLGQTFLLGASFNICTYYFQLYLQNVHNYSPFKAALLQIPWPLVQSIPAPVAGLLQSRWNSYVYIHLFGFAIWTLGAGLLVACNEKTHPVLFCFIITLIGIGVGCVLQPTLVALQAHCSKDDRAVIISSRNFLRNCGGACGLAVSSTLATKTFTATLPPRLRHTVSSTFAAPNLSHMPVAERAAIENSCGAAIKMVFILALAFIALCPVLCAAVKDNGLTRPEERDVDEEESGRTTETGEGRASILSSNSGNAALVNPLVVIDSSRTTPGSSISSNGTPEVSRSPSWVSLMSVWRVLKPGR